MKNINYTIIRGKSKGIVRKLTMPISSNETRKHISKEDEENFFKAYNSPDIDENSKIKLANQFLKEFMPLVYSYVNSYCHRNNYQNFEFSEIRDDLISEGLTAVYRCFDTFDQSKKIRFTTYASSCIQGKIRNYCRDHHLRYFTGTRTLYENIQKDYKKAKQQGIANDFKFDKCNYVAVKSLDELTDTQDKDMYLEYYSDSQIQSLYKDSTNISEVYSENYEIFKLLCKDLTEIEYAMTMLFYSSFTKLQIANKFNVEKSVVEKCITTTLKKMRNRATELGLSKDYFEF
ncbi:sigma-70 family RNA polymerase sigma factor [Finegoldia dalianensis]|uniref:Sigma-70 family RNA polymerase sigma factor n=1 Tax=Finegoldia dalianensis TaxID=3145239 RepID=A0ABW9KDT5_9FIRM